MNIDLPKLFVVFIFFVNSCSSTGYDEYRDIAFNKSLLDNSPCTATTSQLEFLERYAIKLETVGFLLDNGVDESLSQLFENSADRPGQGELRKHVYLQFCDPFDDRSYETLENNGVYLLERLNERTYRASLTSSGFEHLGTINSQSRPNNSNVRSVSSIAVDHKISQIVANASADDELLDEAAAVENSSTLIALFHLDITLEKAVAMIERYDGVDVDGDIENFDILREIPITLYSEDDESFQAHIRRFAAKDEVLWIGMLSTATSPDNSVAQKLSQVNEIQDTSDRVSPGRNFVDNLERLSGRQVRIGVWEASGSSNDSTPAQHQDFGNRLLISALDNNDESDHATQVVGTIIGDGLGAEMAEGMAPRAIVVAYDAKKYLTEMKEAVRNNLIALSNHSWGYSYGWRNKKLFESEFDRFDLRNEVWKAITWRKTNNVPYLSVSSNVIRVDYREQFWPHSSSPFVVGSKLVFSSGLTSADLNKELLITNVERPTNATYELVTVRERISDVQTATWRYSFNRRLIVSQDTLGGAQVLLRGRKIQFTSPQRQLRNLIRPNDTIRFISGVGSDELYTNYHVEYISNDSKTIQLAWRNSSPTGLIDNFQIEVTDRWFFAGDLKAFNTYSKDANAIDRIVEVDKLLTVMSSGNDRDDGLPTALPYTTRYGGRRKLPSLSCPNYFGCLGHTKNAKNAIIVGAVTNEKQLTEFSGIGPTGDGRIKPDVVAYGSKVYSTKGLTGYVEGSGTSFSAPVVTGILALLTEKVRRNNRLSQFARPAMYRAILAHTAEDLGEPGPDYKFGWGLADAKSAADVIGRNNGACIHLLDVQKGLTTEVRFSVPADQSEFKATLAWDDPAPALLISKALVNDLDLEIRESTTQGIETHTPWILDPKKPSNRATQSSGNTDDKNNVEQVSISIDARTRLTGGEWSARISHKQNGFFGHPIDRNLRTIQRAYLVGVCQPISIETRVFP